MQKRAARQQWTLAAAEMAEIRQDNWVVQELPDSAGKGQSKSLQLEPDLLYIETCYAPSRDLTIVSRMAHDQPRVVLTVGLEGFSRFADHRGGEVSFCRGYTTITAFRSSIGERKYEAGSPLAQLRFSIGREWIERNFADQRLLGLFEPRTEQTVCHRPSTPDGLIAARQLLGCQPPAPGAGLRLRSLALSLLGAELTAVCAMDPETCRRLGPRETAIAARARDVLLEEFRNPPTVDELAKRVGVNPTKLKQLFHHLYRDTPYGILTEFRMQEAYRLLEATRCPVSVAAGHVGYGHASNFAAAFMRRFGISPKSVARK